jgi:hypothetical protein
MKGILRIGRPVGRRTIKDGTKEISGEIGLLRIVKQVWDLGSVRIIGPGLFQRVRHRSDVYGRDLGGADGRSGVSETKKRPKARWGGSEGRQWIMYLRVPLETYGIQWSANRKLRGF